MLRIESALFAVVGVTIALVFFPIWFAIPVAAPLAAVYGGTAVMGGAVAVDTDAGLLVFRMGLIIRRVRLTGITAVLVDKAKVSVARSAGGEISLYIWSNSWFARWLRAPAVATDIGHAIAGAVAWAQDAEDEQTAQADARTPDRRKTRARASAGGRSALAAALLGGAGAVAIVAALLVRVHWHNPALTVLGVLLALALGILGLLYLVVALWILITRRTASTSDDQSSPSDHASIPDHSGVA